MVDRSEVRGVVLAGGASTRFEGGEKALATLDDRPLVAHVVEAVTAATAGPPLVAVADRDRGERLRAHLPGPGVTTVVDSAAHAGPLAGLIAGANRADRPWLFVCACDMPLVTAAGIDALRRIASPETDVVVPVVDGHEQPLHALYRTAGVETVRDELPRSASLRSLVERLENVVRPQSDDVDAPLSTAVTNVNTRRDLRRIRNGRNPP